MQVQSGEMWCPNGGCGFYGSQFELLDMIFDPSLADIQSDMLDYAQRFGVS